VAELCQKQQNKKNNKAQQAQIYRSNSGLILEWIDLVGFCPMVIGAAANCIHLGVGPLR
jgi:hypothetical protein